MIVDWDWRQLDDSEHYGELATMLRGIARQ
jgi:hypothetical protein